MDVWLYDSQISGEGWDRTVNMTRGNKRQYSTKEFVYDRYNAGKRVLLMFEYSCQGFTHDLWGFDTPMRQVAAASLKEKLELPRALVERFGTSREATDADYERVDKQALPFGKSYVQAPMVHMLNK